MSFEHNPMDDVPADKDEYEAWEREQDYGDECPICNSYMTHDEAIAMTETFRICNPTPTTLTGFDSAGVLVGSASFGVFDTPDGVSHPRWRILYGQTAEYWCTLEQVKRELRAAGAVTIQEGER